MKAATFNTAIGMTVVAGAITLSAMGDIVGTSHDFTGTLWGSGEICKPCHTPHFAETSVSYLWAHTLSTANYTLYDGTTSSPGGDPELDDVTRMCLSCHDGTVALADYHDGDPTTYPDTMTEYNSAYDVTTDLTDDHPVGNQAIYNTAGILNNFNAPSNTYTNWVWGFDGDASYPEVPLYEHDGNTVVSCGSCHNPHGVSGINGIGDGLLRKSNAASDLCLTCHIK